nr:transketolase [Deltaproteobacteria bacterium]
LQEGISHEAASLAGHLRLGRLIYLYDDNEITIDGGTELSSSDDAVLRFTSYGWHAERVDGHDPTAIAQAIERAKADPRPSLIACRTVIGWGSPSFQGTSKTHGAALGAAEILLAKARLGLDGAMHFAVPEDVLAAFRAHPGPGSRTRWEARMSDHPRAAELREWLAADGAALADRVKWPSFAPGKAQATRKTSQACLKAITAASPWVIGGSADLAGSNGTEVDRPAFTRETFAGAGTLHFGIREHAMGAVCNGIALHGGARPYGATFLIFHDYMRPSVRLSSLMNIPSVWIYTHDSFFLGEDGPTHQPIETLLALRSIPGLAVLRPCDGAETVEAWRIALQRSMGPTSLVLTRQNLPEFDHGGRPAVGRGAYVLRAGGEQPDLVLIGTGSEVALCVEAAEKLAERGTVARVVSMPWREQFLAEDKAYRASVLPAGVPRLSVEAATTLGWHGIVGDTGDSVGIDHFGASAPANVLAEKFGFTADAVVARAEALLSGR